jgi:hypothetical protein
VNAADSATARNRSPVGTKKARKPWQDRQTLQFADDRRT